MWQPGEDFPEERSPTGDTPAFSPLCVLRTWSLRLGCICSAKLLWISGVWAVLQNWGAFGNQPDPACPAFPSLQRSCSHFPSGHYLTFVPADIPFLISLACFWSRFPFYYFAALSDIYNVSNLVSSVNFINQLFTLLFQIINEDVK